MGVVHTDKKQFRITTMSFISKKIPVQKTGLAKGAEKGNGINNIIKLIKPPI